VERLLEQHALNTVCRGAKCPNRCDCYQSGTATFLIMGSVCTRACRFCSIPGRIPEPLDPGEPERLARAAEKMGLRYVVITSVTRDDLPDGGASHFAAVVAALRRVLPDVRVELLVPDFQGDAAALRTVVDARPTVLNHNVETVPALYGKVRPGADYKRSLTMLRRASEWSDAPVKSGLMLGFGESDEEVETVLADLRRAGVTLLTIGQYLKPSPECLDVVEYVRPERFEAMAGKARAMGFVGVASGPFVRSSFRAAEMAAEE
jgi:lipoic acid synthetase